MTCPGHVTDTNYRLTPDTNSLGMSTPYLKSNLIIFNLQQLKLKVFYGFYEYAHYTESLSINKIANPQKTASAKDHVSCIQKKFSSDQT